MHENLTSGLGVGLPIGLYKDTALAKVTQNEDQSRRNCGRMFSFY